MHNPFVSLPSAIYSYAMKPTFLVLFGLLFSTLALAQNNRQRLQGTVLYNNTYVPRENVINLTTGDATMTDTKGAFSIWVKEGDQLAFTAVHYELEVVRITEAIVQNNRLVVEVTEKVRALDEVVVTPENQEEFLALKNETFEGYEYAIDRSTEVENIAQSDAVRGMKNGLNVVNLFKALFTPNKAEGQERPGLKVSEVLRHIYDDAFFVVDLRVPPDKIDDFLQYCDDKIPSQTLLRKENEFQLIDFLVTQSKAYLATL